MAKREQSKVQFDHVQVDTCPDDTGMILSVGSISMWLPEPTAREVVSKLEAALRDSAPLIASGSPAFKTDGSN